MKYKTVREAQKALVIIPFILGIFAICILILTLMTGKNDDLLMIITLTIILGIGSFIYCWSGSIVQKQYYKKGKRYDAVIIGAEWLLNGRENTWKAVFKR